MPVYADPKALLFFYHNPKVYAVDNRCPHMGFPLSKGTVKDSILTCHWHHARFDLNNGGTFDQWAGDVHFYPVEIRNENEVWVDACSMTSRGVDAYEMLLQSGLKISNCFSAFVYFATKKG
jgi:nitrite reductase/ring-hydroxylating ferredoxin subunit